MQRRTWYRSLSSVLLVLLLFSVSAQAATESIAIALTVRGTVEVNQGPDKWAPLTFGAVLNDSDRVRTGADGFVALAFTDDGTQIKLRPNTSVILGASRTENIALAKKVSLQVGELLSDVSKQKGTMEVETPTSVASVKGTEFWTLVDGSGGTTVITTEGLVGLYNIISGTSMDVPAGQYGTSSASGRISVRPQSPAITIPQWNPEEEEEQQEPETEPETQDEGSGQPAPGPGGEPEGDTGGEGGGGGGLGIGGAVGATTIDGVNYQYFSLRPDIPIWKFGIGLDIGFYFDPDGNLREEDWDEASDLIDKIYYLRYGQPGEPTYLRVGNLDQVTLGYGLIMRRYANSIEWPQVRRIGMHAQKKIGPFGLEAVVNNFREIDTPGVVGLRGTFEMKLGLPIVFGATAVMDGNLYLGARDADDDGIPDPFDLWAGQNDLDQRAWLNSNLTQPQILDAISRGIIPDITSPPVNIGDSTQSITEFGVDVGIPLINKKHMGLWLYGQMAKIDGYGAGISAPGLKFNIGPFRVGAEYRIFGEEFMPEFFNYGYEVERIVWSDSLGTYITKKDRLTGLPSAQGVFVDAGLTLMNWFDVYAAYQQMSYGDIEVNGVVTVPGDEIPNKTFYAQASINADLIPKLGLAQAYYQQPQAENLFDATDGSTVGYRIGLEMGGGFMLVMDNKNIYRNGNWEKLMTVETQFKF